MRGQGRLHIGAVAEWAEEVPFKNGGLVVRPRWVGDRPRPARTAFQFFEEEEGARLMAPEDTNFRAVVEAARREIKAEWRGLSGSERERFEALAGGNSLPWRPGIPLPSAMISV